MVGAWLVISISGIRKFERSNADDENAQ